MEYIEIDKKIFLQVFQYEDNQVFAEVCERSQEANYFAIKKYGIRELKRFLFISVLGE